MATRVRPTSFSWVSSSGVASGVVAGVMPMRSPSCAPYPTSSTMSGRLKQSPPENTNTMGPNSRRRSMSAFASAVVSSPGSRSGWAHARQWTHARSHA